MQLELFIFQHGVAKKMQCFNNIYINDFLVEYVVDVCLDLVLRDGVEGRGDVLRHPDVLKDTAELLAHLRSDL